MEDYKNTEPLWALKECHTDTRLEFLRRGNILSYPKGHLCLRAREENTNIFFILSGKVQIYNLTKCGKKKILFILGKNHIANESLVGKQNTIFCETIENCSFYVIRRELLLSLMEGDFPFTKTLLQYQERKLWRLEHQLKNTMGSIYLERKLASKLWNISCGFSGRPQGDYLPRMQKAGGLRPDCNGKEKNLYSGSPKDGFLLQARPPPSQDKEG